MDLGSEYFEGDLSGVLQTVLQSAMDTGLQENVRAWRVRNRVQRVKVAVATQKTKKA